MQVKLAKATSFRGGPIEIDDGCILSGYTWEIQGAFLVAYDSHGKEIAHSATESGLIEKITKVIVGEQ